MKRAPAAKFFCLLACAFFVLFEGSILAAATPRDAKKSPPAQARKSTPAQTVKKAAPARAPRGKKPSPAKSSQKAIPKRDSSKPSPKPGGLYHVVRKGQNLFGISQAYHVSIENLIRANGLARPSILRIGQRLLIPEAHRAQKVEPFKPLSRKQRVEIAKFLMMENEDQEEMESPASAPGFYLSGDPMKGAAVTAPAEETEGEQASSPEASPEVASLASPETSAPTIEQPDSKGFIWPLINRITSRFGPRGRRMHAGIDIAAPSYHEVLAAADGEVIYVQRSRRGLGNSVVLEHGNGYRTVYGHGVVILVDEGETVKSGEPIMGVGSTGRSTGNHLHFEIRKDGVPINPLSLLPPTLDELIEDLRVEQKVEGPS